MTEYHEPSASLPPEVRDFHRALLSLKEEIEAVDWYEQRVNGATDPELARILAHNRDEEIEHACMTLEWLRRRMPGWDAALRTYLFVEGSVVAREEEGASGSAAARAAASRLPGVDLGLRDLKGGR